MTPIRTVGEVFAIYVAAEHWSTGAGRALMQAGVESSDRRRLTEIRLWVFEDNPRARRFYERVGYVTGRRNADRGPSPADDPDGRRDPLPRRS